MGMTIDKAIEHGKEQLEIFGGEHKEFIELAIKALEQKIGHCKDCKWWKDSDGEYRRGCGAESQCPINRKEVFEGNGYCYMFEPQESEEGKK